MIKHLQAALLLFVALTGVSVPVLQAETAKQVHSIQILGRAASTVSTNSVRLSDLAQISSQLINDDDAVIALQKIVIEKSPEPGKELTVSATKVLDRLREEGVDLNELGYTFPRVMTVTRASRELSVDEIKAAIELYLGTTKRDASIKRIELAQPIKVSPGISKIEAIPFNTNRPGQIGFSLKASGEGEQDVKFNVTAQVEEWGEMPVAKRAVPRGSVVGPEDFMMARLNLGQIPADSARESSAIVGLEASQDINFGEVFRRTKLVVPPLVTAGSRVTMVYKAALFEATATGTALEAGVEGQEIRVKNNSSKKIVYGTITEAGVVRVTLQTTQIGGR